MKLKIERGARDDVLDVALKYEKDQTGLGTRFLLAYKGCLRSIHGFPRSFPLFEAAGDREFRVCHIKPFSYVAVFEVRKDDLVLVAVDHVRHGRRHWKRRLTRRSPEEE